MALVIIDKSSGEKKEESVGALRDAFGNDSEATTMGCVCAVAAIVCTFHCLFSFFSAHSHGGTQNLPIFRKVPCNKSLRLRLKCFPGAHKRIACTRFLCLRHSFAFYEQRERERPGRHPFG